MRKRVVFETPWFGIEEILDDSRGDGGAGQPYYSIARGNGVICLVLTPDGKTVLARQYRPPLERHTLEMPAGGIEPGETPEAAVAREVLEETGFVCDAYVRIAACRIMLNRESAVEYFFMGLGARRSDGSLPREHIDVQLFDRPQFRKLIREGAFEQTVALGGLWLAEENFGFRFFDDPMEKVYACLSRGRDAG